MVLIMGIILGARGDCYRLKLENSSIDTKNVWGGRAERGKVTRSILNGQLGTYLSILLAPTLLIRFLFALSACPSPLGAWPLGWPHPVLRVGLRQPPYPRPRGGPSSHITLTSPKSPYAYLAAGPCRGRPPQKIKQVTCRGQCQNQTEV